MDKEEYELLNSIIKDLRKAIKEYIYGMEADDISKIDAYSDYEDFGIRDRDEQ